MEEKRERLMQRRDILHLSPNSEKSLEELEKTIADVEAELVPFRLKEGKKEDVPYVLYLQLTVLTEGPNGQKVEAIERIEYNRPLGSAFTYLIRRLLNKKELTQLDTLRITSMRKSDFFWLPTEINLAANHLTIDTNAANIVEAIELLIHPAHRRPFRTVTLNLNRELIYNEGILNTVGTLIIRNVLPISLYETIAHRRVQFDFCMDVSSFDYIYHQWRRPNAPIGTHFFSYTYPVKGSQWYDYVKRIEGRFLAETPSRGVACLPNCVILPLTDHTQLEFYITPLIHPVTSFFGRECTIMLNFEIQPRRQFN
ncbi:hypothetical protein CAEBREN_19595 [Caenorhabditis brenneri]|uniref:Uncharacterized protein n=1 Tax=Caenorhabditis brenneri TaxID=135651 RepID=G0P1B0_CAEBE|nr:hypothetical protein CAEBREN_19595 [Caenorhabditis brenneri]